MSSNYFSNAPVTPANIPEAQSQHFLSLSTTYIKVNVMCRLIGWFVFCAAFVGLIAQPWLTLPNLIVQYATQLQITLAAIALFNTGYGVIADKNKGYAIRENDFSYRSGVLFKSVISQPILRIQHVELNHGPIDRYFGLVRLEIFSAGGSAYTFAIPGLPKDTAGDIRTYILNHNDVTADDSV